MSSDQTPDSGPSPVELAQAQLDAYNRADLDAFCACYADDVKVYFGDELDISGIADFRSRYVHKFEAGGFGATVPRRLAHGDHCVDEEHWWSGVGEARKQGVLLVAYTVRDGKIAVARFLD